MEGLHRFPYPFRNVLPALSDTDLSSKAEIRIGSAAIPRAELQANGPDDTGRPSTGVRWHRFDRTDRTQRQ